MRQQRQRIDPCQVYRCRCAPRAFERQLRLVGGSERNRCFTPAPGQRGRGRRKQIAQRPGCAACQRGTHAVDVERMHAPLGNAQAQVFRQFTRGARQPRVDPVIQRRTPAAVEHTIERVNQRETQIALHALKQGRHEGFSRGGRYYIGLRLGAQRPGQHLVERLKTGAAEHQQPQHCGHFAVIAKLHPARHLIGLVQPAARCPQMPAPQIRRVLAAHQHRQALCHHGRRHAIAKPLAIHHLAIHTQVLQHLRQIGQGERRAARMPVS